MLQAEKAEVAEALTKIRMAKQNNIMSAETQILVRFISRESNVNAKKQPPVGIKCEPVDEECILGSPAYTLLVRFSNGGHLIEPGRERKLPSRKMERHSPHQGIKKCTAHDEESLISSPSNRTPMMTDEDVEAVFLWQL
ncbi:hypothetical protein H8959_000904 [Pygathrix nigripes]